MHWTPRDQVALKRIAVVTSFQTMGAAPQAFGWCARQVRKRLPCRGPKLELRSRQSLNIGAGSSKIAVCTPCGAKAHLTQSAGNWLRISTSFSRLARINRPTNAYHDSKGRFRVSNPMSRSKGGRSGSSIAFAFVTVIGFSRDLAPVFRTPS